MNVDQRWLLLHMGGWEIVAALCSPDGVSRLMQSCWGSSGGRANADDIPGCPQWVKGCGWETRGGVIAARGQGGPHVKIWAKDINRYAAQIPTGIKAELIACRDAGTANAVLGYRMCRDTREHTHLPYEHDRICPATEAQEQERRDEYWRIVDWQKRILPSALGLSGDSWVAGEQLEMFA